MIADVAAAASKVRRSARMRDDILLGGSQLRGVSGCHGQYLGNMGVKATLVMSVIVAARDATDAKKSTEKLWGLVVCHHYQGPRRVPYYQRSAAEFLVRVFALQLGRTVERERRERERALRSARGVVVSCLKYVEEVGCRPEHLAQTLGSVVCTEPTSAALPMVAKATGAALVMGDAVLRVGKCPAAEDVRRARGVGRRRGRGGVQPRGRRQRSFHAASTTRRGRHVAHGLASEGRIRSRGECARGGEWGDGRRRHARDGELVRRRRGTN